MPTVLSTAAQRAILVVLASNLAAAPAFAAETTATTNTSDASEDTTSPAIRSSVANGALLLMTQSPTPRAQKAIAVGLGGYDSAAKTALFEATTEVGIWGPFSLRGGALYTQASQRLRPTFGARVQVLNANSHGVDGAFGVFYRPEGLTEPEGEIEGVASVGLRLGIAYLLGNLAYGQDPEANERDGEVRIAALVSVAHRLVVGLDSRVRFDLGSSSAKLAATGEPTFDLLAGPAGSLVVGPIAIVAQAGPSVRKAGGVTAYGAFGIAGVGTAF